MLITFFYKLSKSRNKFTSRYIISMKKTVSMHVHGEIVWTITLLVGLPY